MAGLVCRLQLESLECDNQYMRHSHTEAYKQCWYAGGKARWEVICTVLINSNHFLVLMGVTIHHGVSIHLHASANFSWIRDQRSNIQEDMVLLFQLHVEQGMKPGPST